MTIYEVGFFCRFLTTMNAYYSAAAAAVAMVTASDDDNNFDLAMPSNGTSHKLPTTTPYITSRACLVTTHPPGGGVKVASVSLC